MKVTLTHDSVMTIEIDVKNSTKDDLKKYVKKLQQHTQIDSIYPWYVTSNFSLIHTGSWLVNKDNKEVLDKLDSEFAFVQNAINCYGGKITANNSLFSRN